MKEVKTKGWVIVNGYGRILPFSFGGTRKESIRLITHGRTKSWEWYKRNWGLRAVKATRTIEI